MEQKQMRVEPGRGWYSVVPVQPNTKLSNGLFLPESAAKGAGMTVGQVRAVGANDYLKNTAIPNSEPILMQAKIGDMIHYRSAATAGLIDGDGSPLVFVRDEEIIAVLHGIDPESIRAAPDGKIALPTPAELRLVNGKLH